MSEGYLVRLRVICMCAALSVSAGCSEEQGDPEPAVERAALPVGSMQAALQSGPAWTSIGGEVEEVVDAFAIDARLPAVSYLGTAKTLYTSWTLGERWHRSLFQPEPLQVGWPGVSVIADPNRAGRAYVSSSQSGLFVTENAGLGWRRIAESSPPLLAVAPGNPDLLWASGQSWLLRSTDRGQTWSTVGPQYPCCTSAFAVSDKVLYVVNSDRLFRTTDGGETLLELNRPPLGNLDVFALDVRDPNIMYAGDSAGSNPNIMGLRKSVDGSTTWTIPSQIFSTAHVSALAVSPVDGRLYLVERVGDGPELQVLHVSTDGGATFTEVRRGPADEWVHRVYPHPHLRCVVYLRTSTGMYRSLSAGGTCR
jgi:photosystem II stability/assembly factor-like uncharacterized protein